MAQVIRSPKQYDVCIIGSGAGGGMAAKILTEGGLNCVLLEAGPNITPEKDFKMLMWPYELPHRGAGVGGKAGENFGEFLAPNGGGNIVGGLYTSARGANFRCFRRGLGGGGQTRWVAGGCAVLGAISKWERGMDLATIGPSLTKISRRITTKWNPTSGSSERKKMFPAPPTASFCLLPSRAAPN